LITFAQRQRNASAKTRKGDELPCDANGPNCIFIYKTVNESHVGELSFFKVYSGTIRSGMELENESTGVTEKINQMFMVEGNKRTATNELMAGDIGATLKLKNTHVNNTLHARGKNYELPSIEFPPPNMTVAIESTKKGEEEKLSQALHQLREEDPTLLVEISPELKQTLIHCQGDMHLAVAKWKIEHVHRLEIKFTKPRIPYRETIRKSADANYRHKNRVEERDSLVKYICESNHGMKDCLSQRISLSEAGILMISIGAASLYSTIA
jgi:elongation factor G